MNRYAMFLLGSCVAALLSNTALASTLNVFACEPEWAVLAKEVGADRIKVSSATSADQDPHQVQARPSLISAVRRADLVFCSGAELEAAWLPVLLSRAANPRVQNAPGLLYAADHVSLLEKPANLDRSQGDIHAQGNPHLHLDPRRIAVVAKVLTEQLSELDPAGAAFYRQQLALFLSRWHAAIEKWQQQTAPLAGTKVVVHHRSFSYLLDWLNINTVAEMEPKPGLPPSPRHLNNVLQQVEQEQVKVILYSRFNGAQAAEWLAQRSDACAVELPFSHEKSLFALFDQLTATLRQQQEHCR
jgi:zinc/manganese transport system substrate-binding protein